MNCETKSSEHPGKRMVRKICAIILVIKGCLRAIVKLFFIQKIVL